MHPTTLEERPTLASPPRPSAPTRARSAAREATVSLLGVTESRARV
jgi:hypothetical protein